MWTKYQLVANKEEILSFKMIARLPKSFAVLALLRMHCLSLKGEFA